MPIQRKTTVIVLAVVALAVMAWVATRPAKTKLSASSAIPVRVVSVAQQDIPRFVSGIGSVLSLHSVVIRPQVDGILTQLLVKEGQRVKAGDLLASIDDRAIRASLDQAKAQLGESQAQLQVAQVNLKRYKELSIDDGVSKQTYDQQQALVNQLKATALGNQAAIDAAQATGTRVSFDVNHRSALWSDESAARAAYRELASRADIVRIVRDLVREEGLSVLWSTHIFDEVEASDSVYVLHGGKIITQGKSQEITKDAGTTLADAFRALRRRIDPERRLASHLSSRLAL